MQDHQLFERCEIDTAPAYLFHGHAAGVFEEKVLGDCRRSIQRAFQLGWMISSALFEACRNFEQ